MLTVRVLVSKGPGACWALVGLELEMQGFHVLSQVVLRAKLLAAGITVEFVHCLIYNSRRFFFG